MQDVWLLSQGGYGEDAPSSQDWVGSQSWLGQARGGIETDRDIGRRAGRNVYTAIRVGGREEANQGRLIRPVGPAPFRAFVQRSCAYVLLCIVSYMCVCVFKSTLFGVVIEYL